MKFVQCSKLIRILQQLESNFSFLAEADFSYQIIYKLSGEVREYTSVRFVVFATNLWPQVWHYKLVSDWMLGLEPIDGSFGFLTPTLFVNFKIILVQHPKFTVTQSYDSFQMSHFRTSSSSQVVTIFLIRSHVRQCSSLKSKLKI